MKMKSWKMITNHLLKLQKGGSRTYNLAHKAKNRVYWTTMAKKLQQQQQLVAAGTWGSIRSSFHSLIALFVAFLFLAVVFLSQNYNVQFMIEDRISSSKNLDLLSNKCNLFSGKWVFDNKSYPLYKEKECTFMSDQLSCGKFGRKDLSYQFWRWQPHQCDLPRSLSYNFL